MCCICFQRERERERERERLGESRWQNSGLPGACPWATACSKQPGPKGRDSLATCLIMNSSVQQPNKQALTRDATSQATARVARLCRRTTTCVNGQFLGPVQGGIIFRRPGKSTCARSHLGPELSLAMLLKWFQR